MQGSTQSAPNGSFLRLYSLIKAEVVLDVGDLYILMHLSWNRAVLVEGGTKQSALVQMLVESPQGVFQVPERRNEKTPVLGRNHKS